MDALTSANQLEAAFEKARSIYKLKPGKDLYLEQLAMLEQFMEDQGWDAEMEDADFDIMRTDFMKQQADNHQAKVVCDRIIKLLSLQRASSPAGLLRAPLLRKCRHFQDTIDRTPPSGDLSTAVELALSERFAALWPLEKLAASNHVAMTEYLVTAYHGARVPLHIYCEQSPLLRQCRESGQRELYEQLRRYLVNYEHAVARPLPLSAADALSVGRRYTDNINIVLSYMTEVNSALHRMVTRRAFPLQLDVFFVAPECHTNLNLHRLRGLDAEHRSDAESRRNGAVDGTSDVYRLLRAAAPEMNRGHRQRFILLVVRGNRDDADRDTLYVFRPEMASEIAPPHVSEFVEMSYLVNSTRPIVDGLDSDAEGVLGFCHHLHAQECGKVYLSYGAHKSRVFKNGFMERLRPLFDEKNRDRHLVCANTTTEFVNAYADFEDARFEEIGRYWFDIDEKYECWEPAWNPENCRAMGNVFISKECTQELITKIDEHYDSTERLYYRMDYTVGMQIVDKETVHFKLAGDGTTDITLIHMDLHREQEALYAVVVPNCHKSKQKWKVIDYDRIEEAFMTKKEVMAKYGLFAFDLPRGSRVRHCNFEEQLDRIEVNKKLIKSTNWSHIRIVQSKQNCAKSGMVCRRKRKGNGKATARSVCGSKVCSKRFEQLAMQSLARLQAEGRELTPIAHFKFRKNQYHLEKLLPVHIPEEGLVAISFWFNDSAGKTQASGVCLDLTDIRNKANLVRTVGDQSWLSQPATFNKATINNLVIEECEKSCTHRPNPGATKSKNQRRKRNKTKGKAPRHQQGHHRMSPSSQSLSGKTPTPPPSISSADSGRSTLSTVSAHSVRSAPAVMRQSAFTTIPTVQSVQAQSVPNQRMQPIQAVPRGPVQVCMVQPGPNVVPQGYFQNVIPQAPFGQGNMNGGRIIQPMYHGQVQGHFQHQQPPQQLAPNPMGHYGHNGWYQQPHGGRW